jgi:hypothetical protein
LGDKLVKYYCFLKFCNNNSNNNIEHCYRADRLEGNIKSDLKEIKWEFMYWINVVKDGDTWQAVANIETNLWVPLNAMDFLTSLATVSLSRRTLLHGVSVTAFNSYY